MRRVYVGLLTDSVGREVFKSDCRPTEQTHGHRYGAVIGPFRTVRGAKFMAGPAGLYSPLVQTVADAERIAALPFDVEG